MTDYSTKIYKSLAVSIIILLFLTVPLYSQADWTLPLKPCWSITESVTYIASDNELKNTVLFSKDSIKSINPGNGQTLWENKYNSEKFSDMFFIKNRLFFSEFSGNKKYFHSIDISSGLTIWRKEISTQSNIFFYSNKDKILMGDENRNKFYINSETGEWLLSEVSLSNSIELSSLENKIVIDFNMSNLKLTYQGKTVLENLDLIRKNIWMLIPINQTTFIWTTNDNFIGIYNYNLKKNIWLRKIGGQITDIKTSGNTIYVSSFDNFVYLLSSTDGKFLLKRRLDGRVTNSSQIFENKIAVSAYSSSFITIFNLKKNKVENVFSLSDANAFVVHQSFVGNKIIVATPAKVIAFSPNCK